MTIKDFYIFCCSDQQSSNINAVYVGNAGTPGVNGIHTNTTLTYADKPIFSNGPFDIYADYYGTTWRWEIWQSGIRYYYSNEAEWPWLATIWYQDAGDLPVPKIL